MKKIFQETHFFKVILVVSPDFPPAFYCEKIQTYRKVDFFLENTHHLIVQ